MKFELPPLPYDKSALAPHLSARTLDLHYEKHHRGYLTKLEKAIGGSPKAERSLVDLIRESEGMVFNLAAQVWNHSFYWDSMTPDGGGRPSAEFVHALERDFGSFADFKHRFSEAASGEFGSGWAWLVMGPRNKLRVISTHDAENPLQTNAVPLLTIDVWEHAYYLDYQNERGRYVSTFLDHVVNWAFAERNYARSRDSLTPRRAAAGRP
jgi:Fe-Mn family superoxide dismutase